MLQNTYTLPDLIDLALMAPEVGAVNFNILHTILQAIVKELKIDDVRPWCHIENPMLAQLTLTKSKLKGRAHRRSLSESSLGEEGSPVKPRSAEDITRSREYQPEKKIYTMPQIEEKDPNGKEKSYDATFKKSKPEVATDQKISQSSDASKKSDENHVKETEPTTLPSENREIIVEKDSAPPVDVSERQEQEAMEEESTPENKEQAVSKPVEKTELKRVGGIEAKRVEKMDTMREEETDSKRVAEKDSKQVHDAESKSTEEIDSKHVKKSTRAGDAWRTTNLNRRIEATEEGLHRLSNIVDILADKIKKAEARKKGGPSSEELEAIDERLTELEEAMARFAADHDLLMEIQKKLNEIVAEFEEIKALAALIKQMQIDISMKADKEETWAALALKGDLELVNTKVDQTEFETAIEELGEAIGLLGLKFTRKNDEWEERAAEMWNGINGKMTRDVFEAAKAKIESRLIALMYGLRKLKKVVEDLLYPEASGVTRCILCRRPACISGQECIGIYDSPKRPLSDKSSGDEDPDNLKQTLEDAIAKRQKLDAPPYCESRDTIISVPYSSSSYRSSVDEKRHVEVPRIRLMPVAPEKKSSGQKKTSQIPKLPDIDQGVLSPKIFRKKTNFIAVRPKTKPRIQKVELMFTQKLLANLERSKDDQQPQNVKYTAVLETEPSPKSVSRPTSSRSTLSSVDMAPDPKAALKSFAASRFMPDTLRRDVLLNPSSGRERKSHISLSPLQFDTDSDRSLPSPSSLEKEVETVVGLLSKTESDESKSLDEY